MRSLRLEATRRPQGGLAARLWQGAAALLALGLAAVGLVLLVNLPDRDLSAAAKAWLVPAASLPSASGYSLWALDAPEGVDAALLGRTVLDAYRARDQAAMARGDWRIQRPYRAQALVLPIELGCVDAASACVAQALAHSRLVRALAAQHAALLSRIDALDAQAELAELAPPAVANAPAAQYTTLVAGHSLALSLAAVEIGDAQVETGLARLERMTRVAHKVLAGCQTVVCKVTGSGLLRRSFLVYAELARQTSAGEALARSFHALDVPLSAAEIDCLPLLRFELLIAHNLDGALVSAPIEASMSWRERLALRLTPLLFKPGATFNLQAELAEIQRPIASVGALAFARDGPAVMARFHARAAAIGQLNLAWLYNPLGKILAASLPSIEGVAAEVHDVEALQAGLRAQFALLEGHVQGANAAQFLAGRPGGAVDAYTGAALQWSSETSAITLNQRGSRPVKALRVDLEP